MLNDGRSDPASTSQDGKVYVIGGNGFFWHEKVNSLEVYDESLDKWEVKQDDTNTTELSKGRYSAFVVNKPLRLMEHWK